MANCPGGPVWNRRISRAAASSNFDDSYHIDPVLSIIKCYYSKHRYEASGCPTRWNAPDTGMLPFVVSASI